MSRIDTSSFFCGLEATGGLSIASEDPVSRARADRASGTSRALSSSPSMKEWIEKKAPTASGQGQVLVLEPPDPWPDPVDGAALRPGAMSPSVTGEVTFRLRTSGKQAPIRRPLTSLRTRQDVRAYRQAA